MVEKAQKEVEQNIKEAGEQATFTVGVNGLRPELIKLLGRLKYRTSYGQNVLKNVQASCMILARRLTTKWKVPMWNWAWKLPRSSVSPDL